MKWGLLTNPRTNFLRSDIMEKRFEFTVEVTNSEVKEIVKLLDKLRSPAPPEENTDDKEAKS